jgi:hypothetical protein
MNLRSDRVACGFALSALFCRMLCKGCLRLFALNRAPEVRRVLSPTAISLRLLPRGSATVRYVGAPTGDAPGSVSAVSLCVFEALAAFPLQWTFQVHVRLYRHSHAAEYVECSHF